LGHDPQVFHMNEGHAAFSALERIRVAMSKHGFTFDEALESIRPSTLFTTHTPVPAGIDRFGRDLIEKYFAYWCKTVGISVDRLMELGHEPGTPSGAEMNMAVMGLRVSESSNGVAQLHGEVSRNMFSNLWPDLPVDEVPIGSVTNGVNARTWVMREMDDVLERYVGADWPQAAPERWLPLQNVTDEQIQSIRAAGRRRLVKFARRRLWTAMRSAGVSESEAEWANEVLDPDILTIGFARRFATYKRANLLLRNERRLRDLMRDPDRPVQFIFAGKAHPADEPGKRILQEVATFAHDARNRARFVYLEDYDIEVGRYLYQGVDVWLNNPIQPLEACGTSGMKVVYNGGLNLSILDGWWAEMYSYDLGFAVPSARWMSDPELRDERESQTVFRLLEDAVIPQFYKPNGEILPPGWIQKVRNSMVKLGPAVEATRMVRDYVTEYYEPLARRTEQFRDDDGRIPRDLARWKERVRDGWDSVRILDVDEYASSHELGSARTVTVTVHPGRLRADDLEVQIIFGPVDLEGNLTTRSTISMEPVDSDEGADVVTFTASIRSGIAGQYGFAVRAVPHHRALSHFTSLNRVTWAK